MEVEPETAEPSDLLDPERLRAIEEEEEQTAGHQMKLMGDTLDRLRDADWLGSDRLAEAAEELQEALGALDDAYTAIFEFGIDFGTEEEDGALQDLIAEELAAINRRLAALPDEADDAIEH